MGLVEVGLTSLQYKINLEVIDLYIKICITKPMHLENARSYLFVLGTSKN